MTAKSTRAGNPRARSVTPQSARPSDSATPPGGAVRSLKPPAGVLGAVSAAIDAMPWLGPADQGMVALALDLSRRIDAAEDDKAAGYLSQLLQGVLRGIGGAPGERKALGVEEQVAGKLAVLRGRR